MAKLKNKNVENFIWNQRQGVRYLAFPRLRETGLSLHASTSRPFDLGFGRKSREEIMKNRRKVCHSLGINFLFLTAGEQVQGSGIVKVGEKERGRGTLSPEGAIRQVDGMISNVPNVPLTIFTADCIPIFVLDTAKQAIGLVHAGWKGTLAEISRRVLEMMKQEYQSRPQDIVVALGPSIGPCCYEVGEDVALAFKEKFADWALFCFPKLDGKKWTLDLWEATRLQLREAGVKNKNIINPQMCTSCHNDDFFSRRRNGPSIGRMMSIMML